MARVVNSRCELNFVRVKLSSNVILVCPGLTAQPATVINHFIFQIIEVVVYEHFDELAVKYLSKASECKEYE